VYWNAVFKLGGGPSSPLRLLQEAIGKVKPGRSLDAAMGSGRNTIFLAENGWDSHGYDMSEDGVDAAQATAKADGVKISTYLAKHEDFDFGESKWDLIVCSYCFMSPADPHWPSVFLKALKPGGLVVFQVADATAPGWTKVSENWRAFHILRLEDEDPGYIDGDWAPSRTNRTIMLVARKE
jgi:SAM-dependent methyltransferase